MFRVQNRFDDIDFRWIGSLMVTVVAVDVILEVLRYIAAWIIQFALFQFGNQYKVLYGIFRIITYGLNILIPLWAYFVYRQTERLEDQLALRMHFRTCIEMIREGLPKQIIEQWEMMRGDGMSIQRKLQEHIENGEADHGRAEALMNIYHKLSRPKNSATLEAMRQLMKMEKNPVGGLEAGGTERTDEFGRKQIDQLKVILFELPQKQIDGVWDGYMKKAVKKMEERRAYEEDIGKLWNGLPKEIIAQCEEDRGNGFVVERRLEKLAENGEISREYFKALTALYHRLKMPQDQTTLEAMRRVIRAEADGSAENRRQKSEDGMDKEKLKAFKRKMLFMSQRDVDRIWNEYMLSAARTAEKKCAERRETAK